MGVDREKINNIRKIEIFFVGVKVNEISTSDSTSSKIFSSATKYSSLDFASAPWSAVHAVSISLDSFEAAHSTNRVPLARLQHNASI